MPLTGLQRFRPHERLRTSGDYVRVRDRGRRMRTPHFAVNHWANGLAYHRLGQVVPKRLGSAVLRNRLKRRLREWFRLNKGQIPHPCKDIVIIARSGAGGLSWSEMNAELAGALYRQGNPN